MTPANDLCGTIYDATSTLKTHTRTETETKQTLLQTHTIVWRTCRNASVFVSANKTTATKIKKIPLLFVRNIAKKLN